MQLYFTGMNEDYSGKHYPNGSVFFEQNKANRLSAVSIWVFFGLLLTGSVFGIVFGINKAIGYKKAGDADMASVGTFIIGFFVLLLVLSIAMLIVTCKRYGGGVDGIVKKSVKNSQLSENEIREFERQATASDSYILALTGKIKQAVAGQRDGVLTRDYIYLSDARYVVLKLGELVGAFLVSSRIYINVNGRSKPVDSLTITLVSDKNIQTSSEVTGESGNALLAMLLERNPQIDTNGAKVLSESEFNEYRKKRLLARSR